MRNARRCGVGVAWVAAFALSGLAAWAAGAAERGAGAQRPPARVSERAVADFLGEWGYASSCGFGHSAGLSLRVESGRVVGEWSDGTRVRGNQGRLRAQLDGERLYLRQCYDDPDERGVAHCPDYAAEPDYLVRRGRQLVWYRRFGTGASSEFREYIALDRPDWKTAAQDGAGREPEAVERCDEEQVP